MSHNTFGHLFRVTTWGESHGPAIGCVVDGCPPLIPLTEADIQPLLDLRKPGGSRFEQIAGWSEADVDRIDAQLGTFSGRIRRDDWIEQARLLASGDTAAYEARFGKL